MMLTASVVNITAFLVAEILVPVFSYD